MERDRPNLTHYQNLEQEMVLEPESVLSRIHPLSGKDYGIRSMDVFIDSLETSLVNRKKPHVMIFIGEPSSGKSHLARDVLARLWGTGGRKKSKIARLEEETREKIEVNAINWGDVISLAKVNGKIDKSVIFGELSDDDIRSASEQLRETLAAAIEEKKGSRSIVTVEVPAVTFAWVGSDRVGRDRGLTVLWRLSRHLSEFKDLDYEQYWIGVAAHPFIRDQAMAVRAKLQKSMQTPEEIAKILEESGERLHAADEEELKRYRHESPNPKSIVLIEEEVNQLVIAMAQKGKLHLDEERFRYDKTYRAEIMGEVVLKFLMRDLLRIKRHVFIGYNFFKSESLAFNMSVPVTNYIWEKYPEVEHIVNK